MLTSHSCRAAFLALSMVTCSQAPNAATTQIVPVGQPPIGGIAESAVVPVGVVVGFSVVASGSTSGVATATIDDSTHVSLIASSIPGTYVLVGLSPGSTTLHALAGDNADPTTLPVAIIAQTATP
ncbi:MAG: hypothetical protein ACLP1X_03015 [Polyangiaceae bacterium]